MGIHPCATCGKLVETDDRLCTDCSAAADPPAAKGKRPALSKRTLALFVLSDVLLIAGVLYFFVLK